MNLNYLHYELIRLSGSSSIFIYLFFAISIAQETCKSWLPFLYVGAVVVTISNMNFYILWKQSIKLIAASCAIYGSMCFPTGEDLSRVKFCLYFLQRLLALMADRNMEYLNWKMSTFLRVFFIWLVSSFGYNLINSNSTIKWGNKL
jgi:hypothetical protein